MWKKSSCSGCSIKTEWFPYSNTEIGYFTAPTTSSQKTLYRKMKRIQKAHDSKMSRQQKVNNLVYASKSQQLFIWKVKKKLFQQFFIISARKWITIFSSKINKPETAQVDAARTAKHIEVSQNFSDPGTKLHWIFGIPFEFRDFCTPARNIILFRISVVISTTTTGLGPQ